ncbi:MAG: hypothetical protein L0I13_03450 [Lactococcus plantarum]|nr:hypothetical protein [Lactococcus plantarum]
MSPIFKLGILLQAEKDGDKINCRHVDGLAINPRGDFLATKYVISKIKKL